MIPSPEALRHRAGTRRWARVGLVGFTAASMTFNVSIVRRHPNVIPEDIWAAAFAPVVLAVTGHVIAGFLRSGLRASGIKRGLYGVGVAAVGVISVAAFILSFENLTELAHRQHSLAVAIFFPVMLDLAILVCTGILVVIGIADEHDQDQGVAPPKGWWSRRAERRNPSPVQVAATAAPQPAEQVAEPVRVTPTVHVPVEPVTQPRHDAVTRRDPHEILIAPPAYSVASRGGGAPVPDAVTQLESAPVAHPRQGDAPEGGAAMTRPVTWEDAVARQSDPAVTRDGDALDDPGDPLDVAQLDTPEMTRPDPASDGAVDPAGDDAVTQPMARIDDPDHGAPDEVRDADSDEVVARSGDASDDVPMARRLAAVPAPPKLSKRDAEILRRSIAGESSQTIADAMEMSKTTALRKIRKLRAEAGLPPAKASA